MNLPKRPTKYRITQMIISNEELLQTLSSLISNNTTNSINRWYQDKNRYTDQWNRSEDPVVSPHSYNNLIFHKDIKNTLEKKNKFKKLWQSKDCYTQNNESRYLSLTIHKPNSKSIRDFNRKLDTLNLMEQKVENAPEVTGTRKDLLNKNLIAQALNPQLTNGIS